MKLNNTITLRNVFIIIVLAFITSCSSARRLGDDEYLLLKNDINLEETSVKQSHLNRYIRQTPNRTMLGFYRFHLRAYLLADIGRENRFKEWVKNTIGEPPVIYNQAYTHNTKRQFELYMHSKGYFNAEVWHEERIRRNKIRVDYYVKGNEPYQLNNIEYTINDPQLSGYIYKDTLNSLIQKGNNYDADVFQSERGRVSRMLRDNGFFEFNRDYISFLVDTTNAVNKADVNIVVNNPVSQHPEKRDSIIERRHKKFYISEVYVIPEYSPLRPSIPYSDTTHYLWNDSLKFSFLHDKPLRIKPEIIAQHIAFRPGDTYRISNVENSYTYLGGLRSFRFVNINFRNTENPTSGIYPTDTTGLLSARVQLSRSPAIAYSLEAEGLNTAGNLGMGANILLQHRNAFRGAEVFNLRLRGALETSGEFYAERVFESLPFNTFETGAEVSIDFPKLILPIAEARLSQRARPRSSITTGFNYRQRPDYTRYVINVNYGFEWSETGEKRHYVTPIEISTIRIFNDSILRENIPDANPLILSRFRNHLTAGLRYTYEYNTQVRGRNVDFTYLRTNFETSGNLLWFASEIIGLPRDDDGSYRIFNIPFAQYIKGDVDYRYYNFIDESSSLVYRIMAGVGVPFGNTNVLPFVKSYYSGGANSIRGWRIYNLGPGSYQGEERLTFDRYGDIKIEANIEYRFPLINVVKGALFVDAGNVWFMQENPDFKGGEFLINKFYKDLAVSAGFGIRLDFDFFIFRLDAGLPLRNPAKDPGNRWIESLPEFGDFNLSVGIGYPF